MGFFDKLSETISTGSAKVAEKAKEVSGVATITAGMEKEKALVEKAYYDMGKKMFNEHKDALAAALPDEVAKVEESLKKIEDAKAAIRETKKLNVCPGCGKELSKEVAFCPACGAKMPEPEEAAPAEEAADETAEAPAEENPYEENNIE